MVDATEGCLEALLCYPLADWCCCLHTSDEPLSIAGIEMLQGWKIPCNLKCWIDMCQTFHDPVMCR